MKTILIVEDSADCFNLVSGALGSSYTLTWVQSIAQAKQKLENEIYDMILLDVALPDGDGFKLASLLQSSPETKQIQIIFVTGHASLSDKILGFSIGADDYITKPFEPLELKARIDSKFRKRMAEKLKVDIIRVGQVEINKDTQTVSIYSNNTKVPLDLTSIEFKLLLFLTRERNRIYTREEILTGVWGENVHVFGRSVDTHISKLRKKLGDKASYIKSIHGSGYRFTVEEEPEVKKPRFEHSLVRGTSQGF